MKKQSEDKKQKRKLNFRIIIAIVAVSIVTLGSFTALSFYLVNGTEKTANETALTYVNGISRQISNHFSSITGIRAEEGQWIVDQVATETDPSALKTKLIDLCQDEEFSCVGLYGADGTQHWLYGTDTHDAIFDTSKDFFLSQIQANKKFVAYARADDQNPDDSQVIYGLPATLPMESGEESVALLLGKDFNHFMNFLQLQNEAGLVHSFIIRRDGSFVITYEEYAEDNYFDVVKNHAHPNSMQAEEMVSAIQDAMQEGKTFSTNLTFIDESKSLKERRSVMLSPLEDSLWYLVAIMPFGPLEKGLQETAMTRNIATGIAIGVVVLALLGFILVYMNESKKSIRELEKANAAVDSARLLAEKSMRAAQSARIQADKSNKAKSEFLSNMSHDIRTPMNAIVGMTSLAKSHLDEPEQLGQYLQKIEYSSKQLLGLINDVLDMAKIESGKLSIHYEIVSLKDIALSIRNIIQPQIKARRQSFDIIVSNLISEDVFCDEVRLNQVILNLLSNAVKFTPEEGSICVKIYQSPSTKDNRVLTHFVVQDNGIGISKEFQEKIFSAFEREDSKRVNHTEGSGLGMAITKYIVDAFGGTIELESELGKGTTFHITLDLEKAVDESEMKLPSVKILIVDNNEEVLEAASKNLTELGALPSTCMKAEEVDQQKEDYALYLVDYHLGDIDGIEVVRRLRKKIPRETPILLISAYDWSDIAKEAKEAGADGFIEKPLFKSTLYHEIRHCLSLDEETKGVEEEVASNPLKGKRVLVAEDYEINAEIAKAILEEKGIEVDIAENGQICCDMFAEKGSSYYDLILMDLRMPVMDGLEATRKIRESDKDIPIIAMTADAFQEDAQRCLEAGMNAHLTKPIDDGVLFKTMLHVLHLDEGR